MGILTPVNYQAKCKCSKRLVGSLHQPPGPRLKIRQKSQNPKAHSLTSLTIPNSSKSNTNWSFKSSKPTLQIPSLKSPIYTSKTHHLGGKSVGKHNYWRKMKTRNLPQESHLKSSLKISKIRAQNDEMKPKISDPADIGSAQALPYLRSLSSHLRARWCKKSGRTCEND